MNSDRVVSRASSAVAVLQSAAATSSTSAGDDCATSTAARAVDRQAGAGATRRRREPMLGLVVAALREAGGRGLVLASIYDYVIRHSADYDADGTAGNSAAWRKNVRHILSVRNFFVKTHEQNPDGRGRFWRLDEDKYAEFVAERLQPPAPATRTARPVSNVRTLAHLDKPIFSTL